METLRVRLIRRIAEGGPLPFEDFMAAVLYDPAAGFFATGPLRSVRGGDFLTSPEVSPRFGRTLAGFVAAERERLGNPDGFVVVDVGAGSGSLLGPLLDEVEGDAWAVEVSPAARDHLAGTLPAVRVVGSVDDLPGSITGVVFANELLDNLPVSLAVRSGSGWEERWVGATDGGLSLVPVPARPPIAEWADAHAGTVPEGSMIEVQLAAGEWLRAMLARVKAGAVVVIDYGGTTEELETRRTRGTLRTYRAHHLGSDPLDEPGESDVTVDVDFSALAAVADAAGATTEVLRQDEFLAYWGLRDRLSELRHLELSLAGGDDPMERLRVRAERTDAEALLHPRGLGDFRVLVARVLQSTAQGYTAVRTKWE